MHAKYYIYRNLNNGTTFSVKQRGKVVDRLEHFECFGAEFRVSDAGRRRAIRQQRRNVHAFIVTDNYRHIDINDVDAHGMTQVRYNPFRANTFTRGKRAIARAERVLGCGGRVYV